MVPRRVGAFHLFGVSGTRFIDPVLHGCFLYTYVYILYLYMYWVGYVRLYTRIYIYGTNGNGWGGFDLIQLNGLAD